MNNLREGKLIIEGIEVSKDTKLAVFENSSLIDTSFEVRRRKNDKATVRFLNPVQLGSKRFYVKILFDNNSISVIELCVAVSSINEWDYKALIAQHGEWLTEQIGYPEGILDDNVYDWGKINQWDDFRTRDAGITIIYF